MWHFLYELGTSILFAAGLFITMLIIAACCGIFFGLWDGRVIFGKNAGRLRKNLPKNNTKKP